MGISIAQVQTKCSMQMLFRFWGTACCPKIFAYHCFWNMPQYVHTKKFQYEKFVPMLIEGAPSGYSRMKWFLPMNISIAHARAEYPAQVLLGPGTLCSPKSFPYNGSCDKLSAVRSSCRKMLCQSQMMASARMKRFLPMSISIAQARTEYSAQVLFVGAAACVLFFFRPYNAANPRSSSQSNHLSSCTTQVTGVIPSTTQKQTDLTWWHGIHWFLKYSEYRWVRRKKYDRRQEQVLAPKVPNMYRNTLVSDFAWFKKTSTCFLPKVA